MAKKEKAPTPAQISEWKRKAEKCDTLDKEIGQFYVDEDGNELPADEGGDLGDIGEAAAIAFGYL